MNINKWAKKHELMLWIVGFILLLSVTLYVASANPAIAEYELSIPKVPMWDYNLSDWDFRVGGKVYNNWTGDIVNQSIKFTYNFTDLLIREGITGFRIDNNSLRVSEHNPYSGGLIQSNISFYTECT